MKHLRTQLAALLIILTAIPVIIPSKANAVDITFGATTWYSWWGGSAPGDEDVDPAFLYGPVLSVKFNDDFNLTFIYLYGKYDTKYVDHSTYPHNKYPFTLKRSDSDLALNYRLNDYFKLFAGLKYIGMSDSMGNFDWNGWGPGLGLSATFPVAENIFLLGTLSGFHLWNSSENKNHGGGGGKQKDTGKSWGINSTLQLAYYIASASTTISLGGRYQYIRSDYDADGDDNHGAAKFYGVTLTATYSFSI
jgi:hypothetical protein